MTFFTTFGLVLFKFGKSGKKELQTKLSDSGKSSNEKKVEKDTPEESLKTSQEKKKHLSKPVLPSKNLTDEYNRFKLFSDVKDFNFTQHLRNGIQKGLTQNYKMALEDFSNAIELNQLEPVGYYCRAITKFILKNYESAISDFAECVKLQMKEQNIFYYRALANYAVRDFDHAIQDFLQFIKSESNFAEAYFNLALCYKQKKDYPKALKYFTDTIAKNPLQGTAYFERAMIKNSLKDKEGCCNDLKKAMELGHLEAYHYIKELCETGSQ